MIIENFNDYPEHFTKEILFFIRELKRKGYGSIDKHETDEYYFNKVILCHIIHKFSKEPIRTLDSYNELNKLEILEYLVDIKKKYKNKLKIEINEDFEVEIYTLKIPKPIEFKKEIYKFYLEIEIDVYKHKFFEMYRKLKTKSIRYNLKQILGVDYERKLEE
jgi:hypothetical protein